MRRAAINDGPKPLRRSGPRQHIIYRNPDGRQFGGQGLRPIAHRGSHRIANSQTMQGSLHAGRDHIDNASVARTQHSRNNKLR